MDPMARYFEIAALCNGTHSKKGTGRVQIPSEAERKPNWSLMLWSRRIGKSRLGGHGDSGVGEVLAWLGSVRLWTSTQNTSTPNYGEQRDVLQAAVHMAEPARR